MNKQLILGVIFCICILYPQIAFGETNNETKPTYTKNVNSSMGLSDEVRAEEIPTIKSLEHQLEESNKLTLFVTLGSAAITGVIAVVFFFLGQREGKKQQTKTKKHIEEVVDKTADNIVQKVVDVANAQLRVKEGGKVVLRQKGKVAADIVRNISETVPAAGTVSTKVTKAKDSDVKTENQLQHSTDTEVVARNQKNFTIDAVLITEEQKQINEIKEGIKEAKDLYSSLYSKKSDKK